MARVEILTLQVHFGDCDPAGIVFYPNFFRWYDAASRNFFDRCGLPPWRETEKLYGILGTPLVEASSKFLRPATYGDTIQVHTSISSWEEKVFIQQHQIKRGDDLLATGEERRVFARRDPDTGRIRDVPAPPALRALCE